MHAYIKAGCVISPQDTHHSNGFPETIVENVGNRLSCIEPDYRNLINPLLLRRMPRILKMGVACSQLCITRAGGANPDGIIVGTGLGCLDNLEKFLMDVLEHQEHITTVLPFINSTHNAVAAQVSMLLKNNNYNVTYCHRGFSFESALLDALMLLNENNAKNVLVGGIDEVTNDYILLHSYLHRWRAPVSNLQLLNKPSKGTIAGEGSAFFMLSSENENTASSVTVNGVRTILLPDTDDRNFLLGEITNFIADSGLFVDEIDCVLLGLNGDTDHDLILTDLMKAVFGEQTCMYFKHLCGEYYTASAFALWLGSVILTDQKVPEVVTLQKGKNRQLKNLLICNLNGKSEFSLIGMRHGRL